MTNQQYLEAQLGFAPGNSNAIPAALIDNGMIGTENYVVGNSKALKTAAIQVLKLLLSTADTDMQGSSMETHAAIKYDRSAILARIKLLEDELGLTDDQPTITGRSPW